MKKVHELAKELGVKSRDILDAYKGHERINHHHDKLNEEEIRFVKDTLFPEKPILQEPARQVDVAEVEGCTVPAFLETEVDQKAVELAWRCLGVKSPYYKG